MDNNDVTEQLLIELRDELGEEQKHENRGRSGIENPLLVREL